MACSNIKFYKAKDVVLPITFTDEDGDAIDITGSTVYFTAKNILTEADPGDIQVITTAHTAPTLGQTVIYIADTDTDVDVGEYYYDIQLTDATANKYTVLQGRLKIASPVTLS